VAVVIGAGIAGLAAAKVLADRYERVIVLDRDHLPDDASPRRGVPQGHQGHILLVAGRRALESLFPGLERELLTAGASSFDLGADFSFYRYGLVWPRMRVGLTLVSLSRPLLELTVRKRVVACANVTVRDRAAVSAVTGGDTGVRGVVLDNGEALPADLVVDCTGRGGRSDRWLAALGYPAPPVAEVKVGVAYATRLFRRRPGDLAGAAAGEVDAQDGGQGGSAGIFVLPTAPGEKRAGLALPVEGDRWLVSLGGWHIDHPPTEPGDFRRDAAKLPHPAIAGLVASAEPLSDIHTHRFPSSRRRRFEQVRRLPAGYVAVGDAICSFNPVYGQGMTCAALQAIALGSTLDEYGASAGFSAAMARDFYRRAAEIITTPWRFAVGGDFAYPETTGPRPPAVDLLNRYSRQVQLASMVSPEVRRAFTSVQHLVDPPGTLFRPAMVAKVLRAARRAPVRG
jgi:2-polyprenyl-6-methoxyphenol hydroxylase-like FAD-dependent oxidoreductase